MEKVTAYKCDFCKKWLRSRSGMSSHEKTCLWNPAKMACASCGNNNKYMAETDHEDMDMDTGERFVRQEAHESRWCDKFDFDLFEKPKKLRKDCRSWVNR